MKKILILFMALAFLGANAQAKKKKSTRKKAKTTKTTTTAPKQEEATTVLITPKPQEEEKYEPINSLSILNAKSPEAFRSGRDSKMVKKGDSLISVKTDPLKYGYTNDKDVLKSIVVWEIIDMNDKLNQPLYKNEDGLVSENKSLYQILFDAAMSGKIKEIYADEMFQEKIAPKQISSKIVYETLSNAGIDKINEQGGKLTNEQKKEYTDRYEVKSENVKLVKVKGMWYVDRRDGQMKYRLLGLAPMGQDPTAMGQIGPDGKSLANKNELIDLFWVWYPDARDILANSIVFNSKNISSDVSFDDILNARRFSSVIYKSDSGLGNGVIKDYIPNDAEEQIEESNRIKDQILLMENDLWNY